MTLLIIGLVLFLGSHSMRIVAEPLRTKLVGSMGTTAYKLGYSLVALAGFVLIIIGYGQARLETAILYQPPYFLRHLSMLLMLIVFPALLAAHLPGRVQDMLKHPLLVATKAWAIAHLLVNGSLAGLVLFGGFLVWAVADRIAVKKRPDSSNPQLPAGRFNDLIVIVGGLALYIAFVFWLHPILIGVPAVNI
jgi:uncharacterized membrane protein